MSTLSPPERAYLFAVDRHEGQLYGSAPYSYHLACVDANLRVFGFDEEPIRAAGWLHDVVEDGKASIEEIRERFGDEVALTVDAVTGRGETRRVRNADAYRKIVEHPAALAVKLADRIANVENCWSTRSGLLFMYWREYPDFRTVLQRPADDRVAKMWARLDELMGWCR